MLLVKAKNITRTVNDEINATKNIGDCYIFMKRNHFVYVG